MLTKVMLLKAAITVPLNPHSFPTRTSAPADIVEIMQGRLIPIRFACGDESN